jgi:hypothetical protein
MTWLRQQVQVAKNTHYSQSVLTRYKLGMKAGGAIGGVRLVAPTDGCPTCVVLADRVYDPDTVPLIPVAGCRTSGGCRCTYAPVMVYELNAWPMDHRPKHAEYADAVLGRLRLAVRAGGAIGGVTLVAESDSCA